MINKISFFPKNLAYLRKKNNLTQLQLAQKIEVDQTTIGRWEDGNREPSVGNVANISSVFKVSIPDLLDKDLSLIGDKEITPSNELVYLIEKYVNILTEDDKEYIMFIINKRIKELEKKSSQN